MRGGCLVPPSSTFPQAPHVIPDGRLSRVRLATMTLPARPSQWGGGSSARSHTPRTTRFATPLIRALPLSTRLRLCVLWWCPSLIVMAESPFTLLRCYLAGVPCLVLWVALPTHPRYYGLMRQTKTLPPPSVVPPSVGLCRLSQVPAGPWPFPALSPRLFPQMPGPIPRRFPWCILPFLPRGHRPSPRWNRLGTPQYPYSDFRTGMISGLQSFADVQASGFARHPGRSYRNGSVDPLGSRGFYVRASDGLLPPRPSDMLAVRIGQLTAWGLTPHKTRGLAGRSSNEHPVWRSHGQEAKRGETGGHRIPWNCETIGSFLLPCAPPGCP